MMEARTQPLACWPLRSLTLSFKILIRVFLKQRRKIWRDSMIKRPDHEICVQEYLYEIFKNYLSKLSLLIAKAFKTN